jgi:hypothetical protein
MHLQHTMDQAGSSGTQQQQMMPADPQHPLPTAQPA